MKKLFKTRLFAIPNVWVLRFLIVFSVVLLSSCQYYSVKKNQVPHRQYIPEEEVRQTLRQYEGVSPPVTRQPQPVQEPVKIALLAPLTGPHKDLGKGLLDAAQLAIFRSGNRNLILAPYDTKGSAVTATVAAKHAISEGAKIILGPVFSSSAKAVASVAAGSDIQVVSFSNDKSLEYSGVFAIGLMPEQQIKRVMEYAYSKGVKEFVTVLPNDAYGKAVAAEMKKFSTDNAGVSIIRNEVYQVDGRGRPLKIKEHMKAAIQSAMLGEEQSTAPVGVVMPASSSTTLQMLNALSLVKYNKEKVQFIGGDQWSDSTLLRNPLMEGAIFSAAPEGRRTDFENKFRSVYGYPAPKLSSFAYDGIALVATIVRMDQGQGFNKYSLTSPRGFIGIDGIFRLKDSGLAERGYAVMSISSGRVVVADPSPTSFN